MNRCARRVSPAAIFGVWLLLLGRPLGAYAHGSFPAPVAVMTSGDATVVGLNVGLLVKPPEAETWDLSCSADGGIGDVLGYRMDESGSNRVLALLHTAVAISEDLGCTWLQWPIGNGQVLDAGFAADERIWALVERAESYEVQLELWDRTQPIERKSSLLPQGFEIENAMLAGNSDDQRFFVAAYYPASHSAYLLEADADGASWTEHVLTEGTFERPRLVYAAAQSRELVVRLMSSLDERLALSSDGQTFHFSPTIDGFVRALFHNGQDGLLLAVHSHESDLLLRLDREGMPFESLATPFAIRQLGGRPELLFALNYSLDEFPLVFQSSDLGATWLPVIRLENVRQRLTCESVADGCDVGCNQLATLGFLPYENCTGQTSDNADHPVVQVAPVVPRNRPRGAGRGCSIGAIVDKGGALWLLGPLMMTVMFSRRRGGKAHEITGRTT